MTKRKKLNKLLDKLIQAAYEKGLEEGKNSMLLVPQFITEKQVFDFIAGKPKDGKSCSIPEETKFTPSIGDFYEGVGNDVLLFLYKIDGDVAFLKNVIIVAGDEICKLEALSNPEKIHHLYPVNEHHYRWGKYIEENKERLMRKYCNNK